MAKWLEQVAFDVVRVNSVGLPHTLYCTVCGREIYHNCTTLFTGTKGKCDCSHACCAATRAQVHEAHLAYKVQEGLFYGVIPRNYAMCMDYHAQHNMPQYAVDHGIRA